MSLPGLSRTESLQSVKNESDEEFFDAEEPNSETDIAEGREKMTKLKLLKFPEKDMFVPGKFRGI